MRMTATVPSFFHSTTAIISSFIIYPLHDLLITIGGKMKKQPSITL